MAARLKCDGTLVDGRQPGDPVELHASAVRVVGRADATYPFQVNKHPTRQYTRQLPHLRSRTPHFQALLRIRSSASLLLHQWLHNGEFTEVHAPVLTASDCENSGETFEVARSREFFGHSVYLSTSAQLHAEAFCHGLSRVYTFGPTFRAEHSRTAHHAAEFWMLEPELQCESLQDLFDVIQPMIQDTTTGIWDKCGADLEFLGAPEPTHLKGDYGVLTYTDAIEVLSKAPEKFEFPVEWGVDLNREHERYLCEQYSDNTPLFITKYPSDIKPFYMRRCQDDEKTCNAVDLIVPGIGELVGGGLREHRHDILQTRTPLYPWYLQLREYGSVPHGGFGLGFDRYLQHLTGVANIRDVVPAPRSHQAFAHLF